MRAADNLISPTVLGAMCRVSARPVSSPGGPDTQTQAERARFKRSAAYAEDLWKKWPRAEDWPARLTIDEAAAYLRLHPYTVRRACTPDRSGRAALKHQRIGMTFRITRDALDQFGVVQSHDLKPQ